MDLRAGLAGVVVAVSVALVRGAAPTGSPGGVVAPKPPEPLMNKAVSMEAGVTPIALDKHFVYRVFSHAPAFHSPSSMCVSATGDVFVSEDEYNTTADRHEGICRVKMLHDSSGNGAGGHADRVTVFADHLNAPQGLTFVGDTLFVVHAPYVTAFRDTNGDGVADERIELITGLGPKPEGLVHHIPSGIRMGIDGWLYIAIGDKGIPPSAKGRDGRTVSLMGGGIVRVRPDGTGLELFCIHTRNIFDVDIDPYMNVFTRDNTNDGDGWWSRLTQMQRGADIGYPSLYKNYADALIQPIADYGGGGATGGVYVQEPGFPGNYGDSLYTLDWARGTLYRHVLTAKGQGGADFTATQDEFAKGGFPTGVDVDGRGRMYLCNWDRQSWSDSGPVGAVYLITPKGEPVGPRFPEVKKFSVGQLVDALRSPSAVLRREAQFELLRRNDQSAASALRKLATHVGSASADASGPSAKADPTKCGASLYARVAAIFTLEQLQRSESHLFLAKLAQDPSVREFALRALVDRDSDIGDVDPNLFAVCLKDKNARVREQAAIGVGRLRYAHLIPQLVPLTGDVDQMVRHAAMQSLRALDGAGADACAMYLGGSTTPDVASGALRTMRIIHTQGAVDAVGKYLAEEQRPAMRHEAIRALACLYEAPAKPDYVWWGTRPDTRGPYYKSAPWELTPRVGAMFLPLLHDNDVETAKFAIATVGLVQVKEAVPGLADLVRSNSALRVEAARALIDLKSTSPAVLGALQEIAGSEKFDMNMRGEAIAAIGGIDTPEARAALLHEITVFDENESAAPLLDRATDAVASRPVSPADVPAVANLLSLKHANVRAAAMTALLRSDNPTAKERVAAIWKETDPQLLAAVERLPAGNTAPYHAQVRAMVTDKREVVRQAAIRAVGHLADPADVPLLVTAGKKYGDRAVVADALAQIPSEKVAPDQLVPVAQILADETAAAKKSDPARYGRLLASALKYVGDARIPKDQSGQWAEQLRQTGVITHYLRSGAIVVSAEKAPFVAVYPPEKNAAGPFTRFTAGDSTFDWKPLDATDPQGLMVLGMPEHSVEYFAATFDSPVSGAALLSCGSDDGLAVFVNGVKVHAIDADRAAIVDTDKVIINLHSGPNVLLFKVDNHGDGSGLQARIRARVPELDLAELTDLPTKVKGDAGRGKQLFTSIGCVKCHTLDPHEDPKGPYLGDAGAKFKIDYIVESIVKPSAKIAQGFATVRVTATDAGNTSEYIGFVNKETADELQLRDVNGKVATIVKSKITSRTTQPNSIMPEGLADALTLDDFSSLLAYVQSLKGQGK